MSTLEHLYLDILRESVEDPGPLEWLDTAEVQQIYSMIIYAYSKPKHKISHDRDLCWLLAVRQIAEKAGVIESESNHNNFWDTEMLKSVVALPREQQHVLHDALKTKYTTWMDKAQGDEYFRTGLFYRQYGAEYHYAAKKVREELIRKAELNKDNPGVQGDF